MEKESLLAIKVVGKRKVCYSAFHIDFEIDILSFSDRHVLQIPTSGMVIGGVLCVAKPF